MHILYALLFLAAVASAQLPPITGCAAQSGWVHATAAVTAGDVFNASVAYANPSKCSCIVSIPAESDPIYGATSSYVLSADGCACTFLPTADTPGGVLSFRACAFA